MSENEPPDYQSYKEKMIDSNEATSRCFVCNVKFDQSIVGGMRDWPATIFTATGNWGSTIYDPEPNDGTEYLHIRICDACVLARRDRIKEVGEGLPDSLCDDVMEFLTKKELKG